ncbi:hypothetical protein KCP71_21615 [Salmonella enterica subsp. enterica]|nr:hypothetical protein KCP71_21615 [Salmonella enterica subsp. enterica]
MQKFSLRHQRLKNATALAISRSAAEATRKYLRRDTRTLIVRQRTSCPFQ